MKKIGNYTIWLAPFLITAGLTVGFISEDWGTIPLVLIILGLTIAVVWILWQSYSTKWWSRRSTQVGTNALIATLAVVAILGLINFLATRYNIRNDLTDAQFFTLAPQSQEVLQNIEQPVKVWIFDANKNPLDQELLERYQRQNNNFKFEYVDPLARPGLTNKFGVKDYGEVYLESGENRQLVQVVNPQERLSESRLTNRLVQINNTNTSKVYFLQGHGERQLESGEDNISQAVQALADNNYTAEPLSLTQSAKIPSDADAVIIAGPQRALLDGEIQALRDYVNGGGNLLVMVDPGVDPKLDALTKEWGVTFDNRLAINVSESAQQQPPGISIVTQYGEHPITKDFQNGISIYKLARPIETTPVDGVESTPLVLTQPYPASWAESDLQNEELNFDENSDREGPLTLGAALTKKLAAKPTASPTPTPTASPTPTPTPTPTSSEENKPTESRMVVFGDSDFITDGLFSQQLNGDLFLNSITWLSKQDSQPLSIRPKEATNRRLNLSQSQASLIALSSILILPIIAFAAAALLWFQRR
ncbi:Gldg family protein [Plectonema cf. radiosum LEGE 06105]|uniref:Gldg family protein n=1 Tax=Plectonema cf. radiosum LEGE 06105 TaxID=945769 RepID=A0A8J7K594_9CYAN|nr:Gldg family protein [Plectonema radiosum]MBE9215142.1 Gldg family protein [Plectonema cf. radiosum LEGE 06105]